MEDEWEHLRSLVVGARDGRDECEALDFANEVDLVLTICGGLMGKKSG